jgi:hypothetical protein
MALCTVKSRWIAGVDLYAAPGPLWIDDDTWAGKPLLSTTLARFDLYFGSPASSLMEKVIEWRVLLPKNFEEGKSREHFLEVRQHASKAAPSCWFERRKENHAFFHVLCEKCLQQTPSNGAREGSPRI